MRRLCLHRTSQLLNDVVRRPAVNRKAEPQHICGIHVQQSVHPSGSLSGVSNPYCQERPFWMEMFKEISLEPHLLNSFPFFLKNGIHS